MKVLVLANYGMGLYNFRKELLEELVNQKHKVYISLPSDEYVSKLQKIGCEFVDTNIKRRGTNPFQDIKLLLNYIKMLKRIKPDVVLTYTVKPNIYGGIACSLTRIPYITNITGLGTSFENDGVIKKIILLLYRLGLKKTSCVFFQNESNQRFFNKNRIVEGKTRLIPGSGVNLLNHNYEEYPLNDRNINLLFIGRIMRSKGIEELLEAAQIVKGKYQNVQFWLIGGMEEKYGEKLGNLEKQGIIKYYGQQKDVHSFIKKSHATILPSYHEGLSNVLLESASTGRPILASRVPGCIETFDEGVSGIGFEVKNVESLVEAIIQFINLPYDQKKEMGIEGRKKMENNFDRNIVIKAYKEEINKVINKKENYTK